MSGLLRAHRILAVAALLIAAWFVCLPAPAQTYVVTNDNNESANTATIFEAKTVSGAPSLVEKPPIKTHGIGASSTYLGSVMQAIVPQSGGTCIFVSNGGTNTEVTPEVYSSITAINYAPTTKKFSYVGKYFGSGPDRTITSGIGVLPVAASPDGSSLYVGFPGTSHIATFTINSGCTLTYLKGQDVDVSAESHGVVIAMATSAGYASNGPILVVACSDGSIQSFSLKSGTPVSNGDLQYSYLNSGNGSIPESVVITSDGHFAVFGDDPGERDYIAVESYDISGGMLVFATDYYADTANGSSNILLSPNEKWLYVSNNDSGQVTALQFDKTTGALSLGCTSSPLKNFEDLWYFTAGMAVKDTTGTGSVLYVAEDGVDTADNYIGIVSVTVSSGQCTLTESGTAVQDPNAQALTSLTTFTPTLASGVTQ